MKIRLEKAPSIIPKLTSDKIEKARRGALHENFGWIYIFFTGNIEWKSK